MREWLRTPRFDRLFARPCDGLDPRCEWDNYHTHHLTWLGVIRYGLIGDTGA